MRSRRPIARRWPIPSPSAATTISRSCSPSRSLQDVVLPRSFLSYLFEKLAEDPRSSDDEDNAGHLCGGVEPRFFDYFFDEATESDSEDNVEHLVGYGILSIYLPTD